MNKQTKTQAQKIAKEVNFLENLKDLGGSTYDSFKKDLIQGTSQEFINQVLGRKPEKNFSGEFYAGETLEIDTVTRENFEAQKKLEKKITFERRLLDEERHIVESKMNELKIRLYAVTQEVTYIAQSTPRLIEELEVAAIQAPVNPGIYHVLFFENLLEFLKSFKQGIEDSIVWLSALNKKGQKKNFWSFYKQYKGKFLLSGEHFSQRSAG